MADQQYRLRWNNHQQNFITIFKNLLDFEELVDVTISVEGKQIKAHKVVLSAGSPYFKLLFSITPSKHPIVILNDIKYKDMKTIIDFIYCGEVSVSDEQLPDILEVAETLQVSGLYDPKQNKRSSENGIEIPSKKIKRKSENNSPLVNMSGSDIGNIDSINWCGIEPVAEFQDYEHNLENNSAMGFMYPSTTEAPSYIPAPVPNTTSGRRRNSKVQESENFVLALEAVRSGKLGFCKAAKLYGLNNRTLWLEYKKRGYPATRPPVRKASDKQNT